jgi:hypothetical protein
MDLTKIESFILLPLPQSITNVKAFLGHVNYY